MLRFKDFLHEALNDDDDDEREPAGPALKTLIAENCPGFIRRLGNNGFLYRGVSSLGSSYEGKFSVPSGENFAVYRKQVRKDRKPMSTNSDVSRALDTWFEENMGFRARSQAIFVFGEGGRSSAEGYGGKKCIVFPIGRFSYCWSPNVDDLYNVVDNDLTDRKKIHPDYDNGGGRMDMEKLDAYMKAYKYTNNGIDRAIKTDHEIMIDCDEVFLIQYYGLSQVGAIAKALDVKGGYYDGDD